jgi:hypothetical protein
LREWLPAEHLVWFVIGAVERLDDGFDADARAAATINVGLGI